MGSCHPECGECLPVRGNDRGVHLAELSRLGQVIVPNLPCLVLYHFPGRLVAALLAITKASIASSSSMLEISSQNYGPSGLPHPYSDGSQLVPEKLAEKSSSNCR
jgi:hypothetical protein